MSATLPKTKDAPTALNAEPAAVKSPVPAVAPNILVAPKSPAPGNRNEAAINPTPASIFPVVPPLPPITGMM